MVDGWVSGWVERRMMGELRGGELASFGGGDWDRDGNDRLDGLVGR